MLDVAVPSLDDRELLLVQHTQPECGVTLLLDVSPYQKTESSSGVTN
jgi:hypothetical protein